MPLTDRETESQYWLALTAHREARDLGVFGMLAVMQVIMERMYDRSGRWPNTVPSVCRQFECFTPDDPAAGVFLDGYTLALDLAAMTLGRHAGIGHGLAFRYKKPNAYRELSELDSNWAHEIQLRSDTEIEFVGELGRYVFYRS